MLSTKFILLWRETDVINDQWNSIEYAAKPS